ncbi:MAG: hypothetical protein PHC30_11670, partial [Lentisphaeria bacterium]|nr:hypothetical protein [Lentisphaeria bacterium]
MRQTTNPTPAAATATARGHHTTRAPLGGPGGRGARGGQSAWRNAFPVRLPVLGLAILLVQATLGQPAPTPRPAAPAFPGARPLPTRPGGPTGADPAGQLAETERETIAKCLRDLKSPAVEDRRRAAMTTGKYRTPEAEQAVIDCLSD